jgi:hypothetical protein
MCCLSEYISKLSFATMDHASFQRGYTYTIRADWLNGRASASYHVSGPSQKQLG